MLEAKIVARDKGYHAIQAIPGVGPTLAAVFVAEIGDVTRFPDARRLASWPVWPLAQRSTPTTPKTGHNCGAVVDPPASAHLD